MSNPIPKIRSDTAETVATGYNGEILTRIEDSITSNHTNKTDAFEYGDAIQKEKTNSDHRGRRGVFRTTFCVQITMIIPQLLPGTVRKES